MNEEIREQWALALESEKYVQGKSYLHSKGDGVDLFCCLGVLCELAVEAGVCERTLVQDGSAHIDYYDYDGSEGMLPVSVMRWAGIDSPTGSYSGENSRSTFFPAHSLSNDNDNHMRGFNFRQIAAVVRENF